MRFEISCSFMTRRCFSKDHHFKAEIVITPNEAYIPNVWVGRQQQITSGKGRVSEGRGNGGEDLTEKKTLRGRRRERLSSEGGIRLPCGEKERAQIQRSRDDTDNRQCGGVDSWDESRERVERWPKQ